MQSPQKYTENKKVFQRKGKLKGKGFVKYKDTKKMPSIKI